MPHNPEARLNQLLRRREERVAAMDEITECPWCKMSKDRYYPHAMRPGTYCNNDFHPYHAARAEEITLGKVQENTARYEQMVRKITGVS